MLFPRKGLPLYFHSACIRGIFITGKLTLMGIAATQIVARELALPQGAPVVRIQRVRLADGLPLSFDETYLPKEMGEKLMADVLETEPIFSLLEQKCNTPLMASRIFIVPILTMFGHANIRSAIGASIVSVIASSCSSAAPYLKGRLTNIRVAIVLETATTAAALSGLLLTGTIPGRIFSFLFGMILLLCRYFTSGAHSPPGRR